MYFLPVQVLFMVYCIFRTSSEGIKFVTVIIKSKQLYLYFTNYENEAENTKESSWYVNQKLQNYFFWVSFVALLLCNKWQHLLRHLSELKMRKLGKKKELLIRQFLNPTTKIRFYSFIITFDFDNSTKIEFIIWLDT